MSRSEDLIAVIDIGKTHARLFVAGVTTGVISCDQRHFPSIESAIGLRALDVTGIEHWLGSALRSHPERARVHALVPIAHGAAGAFVDDQSRLLIAPDYEDPQFEDVAEAYRPLRDPFHDTFSPFLPLGLNLGRQLFYLQERHPCLFDKALQLLLYPQYWAWRFSGVAATEVTSLGCHSDLWCPLDRSYSRLAGQQSWTSLLPQLHRASDDLGPVAPRWRAVTGLPEDCRVLCGLHDSSAAFLAHQGARHDRSFTLISSGTWTVLMTQGADLARVQEGADMLVNSDINGEPVAAARFMGGREFAVIAGPEGADTAPAEADLQWVLSRKTYALPAFSPAGGPFAGHQGRLVNAAPMDRAQRTALATLYVALMCDYLLDALAARGEILIEGPLSRNPLFGQILAALRPYQGVLSASASVGAGVAAAAALCGLGGLQSQYTYFPASGMRSDLMGYRDRWRQLAIDSAVKAGRWSPDAPRAS